MSKNDEVGSWKLQTVISDIEHRLSNRGASVGSSASMLAAILDDAKKQLNNLDLKQKDHNEEERRKANAELATVVYLVAQETALSQRERQQYGAFIQKDFSTKNDFTALEDFYSNAWDRLTEDGKVEMSQRVWEGVRREEYTFNDLPETVKQKEARSIRDMFAGLRQLPPEMDNISQADRSDFIEAWDDGRKIRRMLYWIALHSSRMWRSRAAGLTQKTL